MRVAPSMFSESEDLSDGDGNDFRSKTSKRVYADWTPACSHAS
jgi:hypothetical protein